VTNFKLISLNQILNTLPRFEQLDLFRIIQKIQNILDERKAVIILQVPGEIWKKILYHAFFVNSTFLSTSEINQNLSISGVVNKHWKDSVHQLALQYLIHRKYESNQILSHFYNDTELDLEKNETISANTVSKFTRLEKLNISGLLYPRID
jgi:hypothetical protein